MDHVINAIKSHIEPRVDEFVEEWKSGNMKKYQIALVIIKWNC